jgi:hypothetical protein
MENFAMKHMQQPSMGGFSEFNERSVQPIKTERSSIDMKHSLLQLDALLELGFSWDEAQKLLCMREQLYDNPEMRQRLAGDARLLFARWLYEHGELQENQ